ncbi:class I SAM-dependent methyltransferase [Brucella cytisi]|uniref:Ubiquinone biosynthesis protein n=1 Tax=Brucella cytisi TaxID=407152 RepID=A0A1J6HLQ6_9HYPH|nr:class I SAM-dependent methyltransferase [Brucella cytisi]OIS93909.1 ubiquinone biosynthesis protein [Brucella cytisi]
MLNVYDYLKDSVPNDHCKQTDALSLARAYFENARHPELIVDLGCGTGRSIDQFNKFLKKSKWIGIDIEASPEVMQRSRSDAEFITFDGIHIPFESNSIEFIYSNQVLEHVRHPERLIAEVARCLTTSGVFIGQTSHLEPYHSFSLWNFTAYGFKRICNDAGLNLLEIRPSLDGLALCERAFSEDKSHFNKWFSIESPLNQKIEAKGVEEGASIKSINMRKLFACGQFAFICKRSTR